jgi:hypothetical protein
MATRSRIGIVNEDGTVSSVYCHWDGYPSGNGKLLVTHYTDRDKVKALIELGSISSLCPNVAPPPLFESDDERVKMGVRVLEGIGAVDSRHTFDNPMPGVTVAYHRDRGEDYYPPRVNKSLEEYLEADNEEYGYVFTLEGEWLVKSWDEESPVVPVKEVLANET